MINDLQLGAKVEDVKGETLGQVKLLVANPDSNQVTHLVVAEGGLTGREIVVENKWFGSISEDGKSVRLNLSKEQLEAMPDFIEREYAAASSGTIDQGYPAQYSATYPAGGIGTMGTPLAAPLAYEAGFAAEPAVQPYTEKLNVPDNSLLVKEGTTVEALDGKVGKVKRVNYDSQSGKMSSIVVEKGLFFTEDFFIPTDMIASANQERVSLNVNKSEIHAQL